tara:strand:- start:356 stop:532 length:177 start_codon:yes stop_codon:yes gene_type:complete
VSGFITYHLKENRFSCPLCFLCSILLQHDEAAAANDIGCIVVGDVHDDVAATPAPTKK